MALGRTARGNNCWRQQLHFKTNITTVTGLKNLILKAEGHCLYGIQRNIQFVTFYTVLSLKPPYKLRYISGGGLHAYKIQLRHKTKHTYPPKRIEYTDLMVHDTRSFKNTHVMTDEVSLNINCHAKHHNCRIWGAQQQRNFKHVNDTAKWTQAVDLCMNIQLKLSVFQKRH
jgi:hypothetical protein